MPEKAREGPQLDLPINAREVAIEAYLSCLVPDR